MTNILTLPRLRYADSNNFLLMAGPCVVESKQLAHDVAGVLCELCDRLRIPLIFKSSYRKANRSRYDAFSGIGDEAALDILASVGQAFNIPIVTDIHETQEADIAARYVDVLQIPAFLCRQTELLLAAGRTGKAVNIKKGHFLSGEAMGWAIDKVRQAGNDQILLTERGNSFGYTDLVVDFRNIPAMQQFKVPVIVDCTHSLQQLNQANGVTGGQPMLIETIASAGIAVGADGLFIETHPNPSAAPSDGANMLPINRLEGLLEKMVRIREAVR